MDPEQLNNPQTQATPPPAQPFIPPAAPEQTVSPQAPQPTYAPQNPIYTQPLPPMSSSSVMTSRLKSKKILTIVAVIAVTAGIGAAAFMLLGSGDGSNNPLSNVTNKITGNGDVVDRKDGTLDLSTLIDKQETIKQQDLEAKLNQQVNLSDGTSYMVTSIERNISPGNEYLKPGAGKELVRVSIVAGNRSKTGSIYIGSSLFMLENSAGGQQISEYSTQSKLPGELKGNELAPGKQVKGTLVFKVDQDEQNLSLVTSTIYEAIGSTEEVTIKSKVSL